MINNSVENNLRNAEKFLKQNDIENAVTLFFLVWVRHYCRSFVVLGRYCPSFGRRRGPDGPERPAAARHSRRTP